MPLTLTQHTPRGSPAVLSTGPGPAPSPPQPGRSQRGPAELRDGGGAAGREEPRGPAGPHHRHLTSRWRSPMLPAPKMAAAHTAFASRCPSSRRSMPWLLTIQARELGGEGALRPSRLYGRAARCTPGRWRKGRLT